MGKVLVVLGGRRSLHADCSCDLDFFLVQDDDSGSDWAASESEDSASEAESESDIESEEEEEEDLKGKGKKKGGKDDARDKRKVSLQCLASCCTAQVCWTELKSSQTTSDIMLCTLQHAQIAAAVNAQACSASHFGWQGFA